MTSQDPITAVILAGGLSSRMGGGNKGLKLLNGQPLLTYIIKAITPQVSHSVINANGPPEALHSFHLPIQVDTLPGFQGPLAGILAGMEWALQHVPSCQYIVTIPADSPFIPSNLVEKLKEAQQKHHTILALARSNGQCHPVVGLWPLTLHHALHEALTREKIHKILRFTEKYSLAYADFSVEDIDPFMNINTPQDLQKAEELMTRQGL
ncbi:molybdenum cofactor guanylyltransferase MobA [Entomobacter blattae]|uniref:Molybdenum cofactor guanylyltransferase n=1 Tax=Entomobacter blattae TaxID=2762277 RepID=A0A7H1NT31_9PROT|nr:molybdenum cofactor guanylyltransferase MobA [Entomobacter blattae]QNT78941.1 Molybdenum cofactor guanylyltransferase [Entomobacter blattae]